LSQTRQTPGGRILGLEAKLGLGFVCAWSRDLNAERGRAHIGPVAFFKVPSYHGTETYKKAIRQHQTWVEPLLAEAKEWHGIRRPRLCGLLNANIQGLLIAVGAEPETHPGRAAWGSRHAPCGSLLALSTEPAAFGRIRSFQVHPETRALVN
jgi:hypothetical protein